MKMTLLYLFLFNLILGLEVIEDDSLLFESAEQHAERVAHQVAERLTVQGIRQTRGYKSNLLKKQRQEAAKAAAEAAAKAAAAATTASPKGKNSKKDPPSIMRANEEGKLWISKAAENADVNSIRARLEGMVKQANQWIMNNIARHGEKDQFKARRLVERYNELSDRYMQVVGRCRDPNTLDELEELRASRPVRKENKARVQAQRSIERTQKFEAKQAKIAERKEKQEAGDNDETERKRRQAGQSPPPAGAKSGKNGKKFRPGRVEKKPLRYYQYLAAQIQRKKLQRNELKCDAELHPDCGKKGKIGQQARKKFRPDPREAMWTKINRALRLAALEVRNECHIWDKIEKKTKKLKIKSHKIYVETRKRIGGDNQPKLSKKQILAAQNQSKNG